MPAKKTVVHIENRTADWLQVEQFKTKNWNGGGSGLQVKWRGTKIAPRSTGSSTLPTQRAKKKKFVVSAWHHTGDANNMKDSPNSTVGRCWNGHRIVVN